ncbi:MAG TPA: MauE/DoxX family redox-associated membrane protein [Bacteroidota bacterium]|nr:MauE/DoxX family redox-associated membrane protein [Bacteroidota bacterium]
MPMITRSFRRRPDIRCLVAECVRLFIGAVFLLAGIAKLLDFPQFLTTLHGYAVLPHHLVMPAGIAVVLAEVLLGSLLGVNLFVRETASLLTGMTLLFIAAIFVNIVTGRVGDCGCFGSIVPEEVGPGSLLRDSCLLAGCAWIALIHRTQKKASSSEREARG